MSMTVTQAQAVFDIVDWLARTPSGPLNQLVADYEAREALRTLADHAGKRMQLTISDAQVDDAIKRKGRVVP